jgi:opacity protein-like surface antigen
MQRKLMSVLVAAALFIAAPQALFSQNLLIGPEIAWNNDFDIGIGAGVEFGLGSVAQGLGLYGDFLYFFAGDAEIPSGSEIVLRDQDYFEFNANATYVIPLENSSITPFALAGANIGIRDVNTENLSDAAAIDQDTQVGLNLGGGIQFNLGDFRPRAGARFVLGGYETFTVFGFLPFQI